MSQVRVLSTHQILRLKYTYNIRLCPEQNKGALKTGSLNNLGALFCTPSKNAFRIYRKVLLKANLHEDSNLEIFEILKVYKIVVILKGIMCL